MTRAHRSEHRQWASRFGLFAAGLLVSAASGLAMSAPSGAGTGAPPAPTADAGPTTGSIVPCPAGTPSTDSCASMPCPTDVHCGEIEAGPTQSIGEGQYVYLTLTNFNVGDLVLVSYCSDPGGTGALPAQNLKHPPPALNCATSDTNYSAPATSGISIFPSAGCTGSPPTCSIPAGTAETSVQTEEESPPGIALEGTPDNFYCDDTGINSCVIVITDFALTGRQGDFNVDAANSVAIPLQFATSAGVPGRGPSHDRERVRDRRAHADIDTPHLLRVEPRDTRRPADGGVTALQDLAAGTTDIGFTDDPESPDQQTTLTSGPFKLIPIALTANILGVDAQIRGTGLDGTAPGINYPINEMELTPTMAAGLIMDDQNWQGSYLVDDQVPCSGESEGSNTNGKCAGPPCGVLGTETCSLFDQLNYLAGFNNFFRTGSIMQEGSAGATDQLFTWLCGAPKAPLDFGVNPVESQSGQEVLEGALGQTGGNAKCPSGQDSVPGFNAPPSFNLKVNPAAENLYAPVFVENQSGAQAAAAFVSENWAEGEYYGINAVASLQNAAGDFVLPTPASLDAAVADATTNADGSITPNYASTDPAAYPMPDVIYAVVKTSPMPAAQAAGETDLLTQMLQLTGTGGTNVSQLPPGFAPLPANLVSEAQTEIKNDIVAVPTAPAQSGGGGSAGAGTGSGGSTTPTNSTSTSSDLGPSGLLGGSPSDLLPFALGISPLASVLANVPAKAGSSGHGPTGPLLGPALPAYALAASQGSTLLTVAWILGLVALLVGLLLMSSGALSRIRSARGPTPADDTGGDADDLPGPAAAPA